MTAITPHMVQANFIAYLRHFAELPGITFVEEEHITWITSNGEPGSQIVQTQFTPETAAERIRETLRQVGRHTDSVDWMLWPSDLPADIGHVFAELGTAYAANGEWMLYGNIGEQPGTWLVIDFNLLADQIPVSADFRVEQVSCPEQFAVWVDVNANGFGKSDYSAFREAYVRQGFGEDADATHYVGFLHDQPVTSSTLLIAGGSASVYNVSTPVEHRGNGFGSAITHATLLAARERGYTSSWIWASQMATSVYQKLGFVVTDFGIREYQWKKRT